MTCHGQSPDSPCCLIPVGVDVLCKYVVPGPHPDGRRAACGLYVELGSWDAVHADERYLADVHSHWVRTGTPDCGDWVGPGCCYGPERTDASREAYRAAAMRPGTPVEIQQLRGVVVSAMYP